VRLLLDVLPELLVEFDWLPGPAAPPVQANRRAQGSSRDEATGDRLDNLEGSVPPVKLPYHHELPLRSARRGLTR